eukprot:s1213_g21.t1
MCAYGLKCPDTALPIQKATGIMSSSNEPQRFKTCPGCPQHRSIAGKLRSGQNVSAFCATYTQKFVKSMLETMLPGLTDRSEQSCLAIDADLECLASEVHAEPAADGQQPVAEQHDPKVMQAIRKLHCNLGHPNVKDLVRILRHSNATSAAIKAAQSFECDVCRNHVQPASALPAKTSRVTTFNEKIGLDVKYLPGWKDNQQVPCISIVDYATSLHVMAPIFHRETAEVTKGVLRDSWITWAGVPQVLELDPSSSNLSDMLGEYWGVPDLDPDDVIEVVGNVYGSNDAPFNWWHTFDKEMQAGGWCKSQFDNCLYYLFDTVEGATEPQLCGVLGAHVDDTITGGAGVKYQQAIERLKSRFPYRKWRQGSGEFCGVQYSQNPTTMEITYQQKEYAQHLRPISLTKERQRDKEAPATDKEVAALRAINGAANWLNLNTSGSAFAKLQLHHAELVTNEAKNVERLIEILGGHWGRTGLEKRHTDAERALYQCVQQADESHDSYLARADVFWTKLLAQKIKVEDLQAYVTLRGSLLTNDDKKRVILESDASLEGKLTVTKVTDSIRMLGTSFFHEMTRQGRKVVKTKVHDQLNVAMDNVDLHADSEDPVTSTSHEDWNEDDFTEALAQDGDDDAIYIMDYKASGAEVVQGDEELASAYSTYVEARRKLSEKFRSRGFWPISSNKGKGKGTKGNFKSKGSWGRQSLQQRILDGNCRICGKKGHWKSECPQRGQAASANNATAPVTLSLGGRCDYAGHGQRMSQGQSITTVAASSSQGVTTGGAVATAASAASAASAATTAAAAAAGGPVAATAGFLSTPSSQNVQMKLRSS